MSRGVSVAIINTGELKELLGNWGSDNTSSTRSWHKLDTNGGALSSDLSWNGMDATNLVTPETSSDWHKLKLGSNDGSLDGDLDFLGDLDSKTDVSILISNSNDSLEAGSLSGLVCFWTETIFMTSSERVFLLSEIAMSLSTIWASLIGMEWV
jgi:hypothetical protein